MVKLDITAAVIVKLRQQKDMQGIFKQLMYKVIASKLPYQVKIDSLARELKISEPTLYTYLEILNKTGIFKAMSHLQIQIQASS